MKTISILNDDKYLSLYIKLCCLEWGSGASKSDSEINRYILDKKNSILNGDKVLSIIGLIDNDELIGFVSLLKSDGELRTDLTPWFATLFIKEEFRGNGYSSILVDSILNEARKLSFEKVYLKTSLNNYYEKFGARYVEHLDDSEKLYCFELTNIVK